MGRRVRTIQLQSTGTGVAPDGYFDRLIKYIPGDIVGGWVAITGSISALPDSVPKNGLLWWTFGAMAVLTAAWTWKQTREPGLSAPRKQIVISTLAFCVWVIALGAPFDSLDWYHKVYGSVLLILFLLCAPLFDPD